MASGNLDQQKIQEMQMLEQNLQNLLMQKQAYDLELSETESALKQLDKSDEEVFKIVGQLMIKSDKKTVSEELENKKKLLSLRVKTFDKQSASINEQLEKLREQVTKSIKK